MSTFGLSTYFYLLLMGIVSHYLSSYSYAKKMKMKQVQYIHTKKEQKESSSTT